MKKIVVRAAEGANQTAEIGRLLRENREDVTLVFEPKEYHFYRDGAEEGMFYPANNKYGHKFVIFYLHGCRNVTLEGNGAAFVFHDRVFPFILQDCENVTLRGFSVDFAFPRCYSAVVEHSSEECLELFIDREKYPYSVEGGVMVCHTESEDIRSDKVKFFLSDYDKDVEEGTNIASIMVGDCPLPPDAFPEDGMRTDACVVRENVVRFTYRPGSPRKDYVKGHNIVFHFDEDRQYDTFFAENCRATAWENVRVYRGCGMGLIAQFCEDIRIDGMQFRRKEGRGDLVTTTADALMFVNCSGKVSVKNSYIANSLDDAVNLHGLYTHIEEVLPDGLLLRLGHREQVGLDPFRAGDVLTVIGGGDLRVKEELTVLSSALQADKKHIVVQTATPPSAAAADDFAENCGRMPEAEFIGNEFEMCPSIILATPKKAIFAHNRVHNRCAGLRVVDSPRLWYEAGRAHDVQIEDNEFISCGEGYDEYTICVTVNAAFGCGEEDHIHENIRIRRNRFAARNGKLLSAEYTRGLAFEDNEFIKSGRFRREGKTCPYRLVRCKDVSLRGNVLRF